MNQSTEQEPVITRQFAIYDPRHLPEADFLNSFVGRHQELQHLIQQIKLSDGENKNHLLIYGSRGMGKTSMLRRIAIAIRDDDKLSQQWIPVNFREEQYNVRQLGFFWKNTADAVAEWCEQTGDNANAIKLDNIQDSSVDADTLWDLLNKVSQQHNARLLLLVDNLNLILQNLTEQDQWVLRKILSQPDGPMMIAATTTLIKELTQRDAPFYDYFQLQDLLPLSATELRSCLLRIADSRGIAGRQVTTEINQRPERLQVLHTLTNGNPRTLFHIYQILEGMNPNDDNTPDSFMALLESLLDSVTPLYKARTEELTPQQCQVLDAIALAWDPKNSAWIANKTQLAASTLSPQLKRLRELGIIEEVRLANNKKGVQLRERFYNIWYLLRNGSRRGRQRLRFFTCFLMDWYSPSECSTIARQHLQADNSTHLEYNLALASAMESKSLRRALEQDATMTQLNSNPLLDGILDKELDSAIMGIKQQQYDVERLLQDKGWKNKRINKFWQVLSANLSLSAEQRQKIINAINSSSDKRLIELLSTWEKQEVAYNIYLTAETIKTIQKKQQEGLIRDYKDIEGFLAIAEKTGDDKLLLFPLLQSPKLALQEIPQDKITRVLEDLFYRSENNSKDMPYWNDLGYLLQKYLSFYTEAEKAYCKAIELEPTSITWNNLGVLLQIIFRYNEAEKAYRKAIKLDPRDTYPHNNLGNLLSQHLSHYSEAEKVYRKAIELDPKYVNPWIGLGNLLQDHFFHYKESEKAYLMVQELGEDQQYAAANLCWLAIQQKQYKKAVRLYQKLDSLSETGKDLLKAGLTISQDNFGDAWVLLDRILKENKKELWLDFRDDLLRLVRLFLTKKYGERLLESMKEAAYPLTHAPFYRAVEASVYGEELLNNCNPEVRLLADSMFHWMQQNSSQDVSP